MESISILWTHVLPFLAVLTVLVFVHELGHYLSARRNGIRVEVFSVGFGPEIWGWTDRHQTRWKISSIPFGGYVKMFGEQAGEPGSDAPERLSDADRRVSFAAKSVRRRAEVVFAGPFANFLFAVLLFAGMFAIVGEPYTPADVGSVMENSAAARAGLKPGDAVRRVDGVEIERFEQLRRIVQLRAGVELLLEIERDGKLLNLGLTPDSIEITDRFGNIHRIGRMGISRSTADRQLVRHDPATAVWRALKETASITDQIFDALGQIIAGTRTAKELGGPLRIAQMSGDVAEAGIISLIQFAALLSINLGLINLFPIPMLDGGHLLFFGLEAVRGKPVGERVQEYGYRLGLAFVIGLMVFVTWNDLVQMRVFEFFVNLVT